ncbi:MAG: trigger factor [Armatimonadetes bacterium]|nr:trigger factor [Armatimonadota bacterium]
MPTATKMSVKREDLNPCTIKLEITCSPEQVTQGYDKAYKQFAKQMRVPGFRPGHAPKHVVAPLLSPDELNSQAADNIVNSVLKAILVEEKIQPHDSPAVSLTKIDIAGECEFTAKVPLAPIVELGEYKGIEVNKQKVVVTDVEVQEHLDELRKRAGKREAVADRAAEEGDIAVVNIKTEKETGDGQSFMVVVGKTFEDMDKAVLGMAAEEMKVVTLNFPANFQDKSLAGKKEKVKLAVKSLNTIVMPELTDEFAQSLGGDLSALKSEDVKTLKGQLHLRIEAAKAQMSQEMVNESIQEELVKRSKIEVPDTMWESVANQRMNELAQEAHSQGSSIEAYAKSNGMTVEEMVANWQTEAKIQVMRAVAAREVFAKEKLKLSNQDMNEMLIAMAYEYQVAPAEILQIMKKNNNFRELEIRAVFKKVIDFLNKAAVITEVDELGSAPAAKPAKKKSEAKEEAAPVAEKPKKAPAKKKSE